MNDVRARFAAILERLGKKKKPERVPLDPEQEAFFRTPEGREQLKAYFRTPQGQDDLRQAWLREIRDRQPQLLEALWADAKLYSGQFLQEPQFKTWPGFLVEAAKMSWTSDAYLCMVLYRIRTRLNVHGIPVLPTILHRTCMMLSQICIGKNVAIDPGVYIPHGQVVIDGRIEIGTGTVIAPWVTLGRYGEALEGPTIGNDVFIGTGAKIFGAIKVGDGARIAANAVVVRDVPPNTTVGGAPAKVIRDRRGGDDGVPAHETPPGNGESESA
jgi:serine O-acetyltransferase